MKHIKTFEGFFDKVSNFIRPTKSNKNIIKEIDKNYEKLQKRLIEKYKGTDVILSGSSKDSSIGWYLGISSVTFDINPNFRFMISLTYRQFESDGDIYGTKVGRPILTINPHNLSGVKNIEGFKKFLFKLGFTEKFSKRLDGYVEVKKDYIFDEDIDKIITDVIFVIDNIEEKLFQDL